MGYFITEAERKALHSTCFHEFMKGEYNGECWHEDSLLLSDDEFSRLGLYKIFKKVIPDYDPYGIVSVMREQWEQVKILAEKAGGEILECILEVDKWVNACFEEFDRFTICGI